MEQTLEELVRRRANGACEYCHMPEALHPSPFQVDHVIAQQHHGPASAENLAWSCLRCNSHKGPNLSGYTINHPAYVELRAALIAEGVFPLTPA